MIPKRLFLTNYGDGGEDDDLFESPLCESGTLEVLHRPDLVCKLLTLQTNSFIAKASDPANKFFCKKKLLTLQTNSFIAKASDPVATKIVL